MRFIFHSIAQVSQVKLLIFHMIWWDDAACLNTFSKQTELQLLNKNVNMSKEQVLC